MRKNRNNRGLVVSSDSNDNNEFREDRRPNFFGRLYDKIKAEYFDNDSSDAGDKKSSMSLLNYSRGGKKNAIRKVPSLKSMTNFSWKEKRVSFMDGQAAAQMDKNY